MWRSAVWHLDATQDKLPTVGLFQRPQLIEAAQLTAQLTEAPSGAGSM